MSKRFLFFAVSGIGIILFVSSLTPAAEKNERGNVGEQLNLDTQAFDALGAEFSVLRRVLEGLQGSDPNNLLWNRADGIVVLDSTLFKRDGFKRIVPVIYFSLDQQEILSSINIRFSTLGAGFVFYLNK